MNLNKLMFTMMLILGTSMTLSSHNWLSMWMGLEMNMMAFIPLISKTKTQNSSQSVMIYFLVQSISSLILMFTMIYQMYSKPLMQDNNLLLITMYVSLFIKLGAAPFHLWLPEMMSKMKWLSCLILMTWQKVAPMFIMFSISTNHFMINLTIMMSTLMGSIGGMNQTSMRKIMAYSSINHMGWMMMLMKMKPYWWKYLVIYSVMLIMLIYNLNYYNIYFLNQMPSMSKSLMEKLNYTIMMLSLGGMPPLLGFMPKWMTIQASMENNLLLMLLMLLCSMITLFYYMRMMTSMSMMYSTMNKWINKPINYKMTQTSIMINMLLPIMMMFNL